ncbi:hypothetical protein [Desulfogranum marinum]|uniref:hypothetical protein n=1 Tax=Desulfogranum marinum TaxID=453220 RepID=UPI001963F38E|nr:hypothetical protein [Desulfogranum marinum]MBM9515198.1 hypothetical protein [Desulfogranum marinum]
MKLPPSEFGLPSKTVIEQIDKDTIAIVIDRKSRVIMKDGENILEKANMIKGYRPRAMFALKTTAPVCSKTKAFLEEEGILIIPT